MIDSHNLFLLVAALVSVIGLIMMIAVVKLNPVITLFITALALAIVSGMPLTTALPMKQMLGRSNGVSATPTWAAATFSSGIASPVSVD